jgi:hypothetical protein
MGQHYNYEDFKREFGPDLEAYRREHPWRTRWLDFRFRARLVIYKMTRIDIG